MKPKKPSPPSELSAAARKLWGSLVEGYRIADPAGRAILREGLRSWDRADEARRAIARDGCVLKDRWGQLKPHPAAAIERDARQSFLAALRQLKVDVPVDPGEEV